MLGMSQGANSINCFGSQGPQPLKGPMGVDKEVLLLGEGNFSFSSSVCSEEDARFDPSDCERFKFSNYVVTTEMKTEKECKTYPFTRSRLVDLRKKGALPLFEIDCRRLPECFPNNSFKMIIFNCPDVNHEGGEEDEGEMSLHIDPTAALVSDFFTSASKVQQAGARIYMNLIQPDILSDPENSHNRQVYYQGFKYGLVDAATKNGYRCITIRPTRPYNHQKTKGFRKVGDVAKGQREFVFEKTGSEDFVDPFVVEGTFVHDMTGKEMKTRYYEAPFEDKLTSYDRDVRIIGSRIFALEEARIQAQRVANGEDDFSDSSSSDEEEDDSWFLKWRK